MYILLEDEYVIRVPPELLNDNYSDAVAEASKSTLEGKLVDIQEGQKNIGKSYIVSVNSIEMKGEGTIVHGDGGVYQSIKYSALAYFPKMHEVVDGIVVAVQKFGAFIKFGPFEGLLHISQIMDDAINIDMENQRIVGKDSKMELKVGDKIRVRIVALNLSSASLSDSKIGFTAKQPGLGKLEWMKKENVNN
ncbi:MULTISPECIES: DNA-directed RNA polymerase [Ferroplasma]|jgi:DNA-directed RNA polymerase subunit E'|uniref:DNA-directed RNA polymerase subunit Rpo7 n=2 Tax=Ferroplasma TaxID=74968 RepID=S0ATM3_FERAC|nr:MULTISPECIES: DNA-directed RNA polymerase [Ferroplasma]MCL4349565.1 DNA-directed RNA polymerase [Candidatus Thermoplasmatota archaeon]AGO61459.1 DNA-directed RNA polymerase subunit E' [Ferroplasma acidarmanus Fer1]ARD84376.1 DNA-directed RNA polymerase subunit E' [Ferroplasma acidiphilum]NOL61149.1 DNA-directed RNA polymerase [Ferroplasma acidiphilum]WMT53289.1 MAG: DNA-directed RNA polymerase [Ferroplasma acidiphilum]